MSGCPRTLEDVAWEATSSYRFRGTLVITPAALALPARPSWLPGSVLFDVDAWDPIT